MSTELAIPETKAGPILTRTRFDHLDLPTVKERLEAEIGKPNEKEIDGHPPGTLRAKAVSADGGPRRWRAFIEWEPITP